MPLVYYSIMLPEDEPRLDLVQQFGMSVGSLRAHNRDVQVVLFLHGPMNLELATVCRSQGVMVHFQGPYAQRLASLCPQGWMALSKYPLLHKFLNFRELVASGAGQVLFCDCDTYFFRDVAILFDRYSQPDIVAREEVHSSRSPYGVNKDFMDEELLRQIAASQGAVATPPFNLGVVLFNHDVCRRLIDIDQLLVDYAWRFVTWMALNPLTPGEAKYTEFKGIAAAIPHIDPNHLARALPFPSANRWILDEVALWMSLGHITDLSTSDFAPSDVAQNGEFALSGNDGSEWILCHYFSHNLNRMNVWLGRGTTRALP